MSEHDETLAEKGNGAVMREALEELIRVGIFPDKGIFAVCPPTIHGKGYSPDNEWCAKCKSQIKQKCEAWYKAKAALAKPPRACDVMPQEDLTKVVIGGFLKSIEARSEFNIVGAAIDLVEAAISAAIRCAYDTQLVVRKGKSDGNK